MPLRLGKFVPPLRLRLAPYILHQDGLQDVPTCGFGVERTAVDVLCRIERIEVGRGIAVDSRGDKLSVLEFMPMPPPSNARRSTHPAPHPTCVLPCCRPGNGLQ